MNVDEFSQQIQALRSRFAALLQRTEESPISQQELVTQAFEELDTALEQLKVAEDQLVAACNTVEAERQRYQDLFEFAPDGYLVTDANATIQEANRAACTLLKISQQFLVGKPLINFIPYEERRAFRSQLHRLHQLDWVQDWEMRISPRNGANFDAVITVAAVRDRVGKLVALRWLLRDITERNLAESALRESNERFRLLVENVKDYAIFTLDPDGYVASWNLGAESILGYQEAEIIGQHASCIFTPEDIRKGEDKKELRTAVAVGRAKDERWHVRADGTRFWASGIVTPLRDEAGNLLGFSKIMRDMTERKQAEAVLQQLNAKLERQVQERTAQLQQALKFEAMLKRITDKVRDSLDSGQILQTAVQELAIILNLRSCNAALYNLNEGTSTICYEYVTSVPASQGRAALMADFPEIYHQLLSGQYLQFCSIVPVPSCGLVMMLACPIVDGQGVVGDLWLINQKDYTFNDLEIRLVQQVANQCAITIRQARLYQAASTQVKELEKLNQLKDDFLSTVSHELRTPMSNMKMAISMLKNSPTAERSQRYLEILQNECTREIELINDLLDLQRLETASYPSKLFEAINLQDWLPTIIEPFQIRTQQRQQALQINLPLDLPPLIADRANVERILVELLNNACKYTASGGEIVLSVECKVPGAVVCCREPEIERLQLSPSAECRVKEFPPLLEVKTPGFAHPASSTIFSISNAAEIPSRELPRIFDKFYRVPNADPWKQGGTGLGLALVQRLVSQMQGTIQVESSRGWTTFTVELPNQPSS